MLTVRLTVFFAVSLFQIAAFAQSADDAEKESIRKRSVLIDQVLADAGELRLGENRSFALAKVGVVVCKTDKKAARSLFQNAVGELLNAQSLAESDQGRRANQNELLTGQATRPQILNTIAACDAEYALESLYKTRPAAVVRALPMPAATRSSKISNYTANYNYIAHNERQLEQSLVRLAADQNPERAVALLKESLKNGLSGETFNLLKKLHEKDPESAAAMASEVTDKLTRLSFSNEDQPDYQSLNLATVFLTDFIREKNAGDTSLKLDDPQMRGLAGKLISFYLQKAAWRGYVSAYSIIPIAEKLSPASVEEIKKASKNGSGRGFHHGYDPELTKLLSSDVTPENLLAEAKKYGPNERRQIYQTVSNKFVQAGNFDAARQVLNDNFSDDALDDAMSNLNAQYSYQLINAGRFNEAEQLINDFPETTRIGALINLAQSIYNKNPEENASYAGSVLGKARAAIPAKPENSNDMLHMMQIISAYANIDASESFRLFEPLIPQMNELTDAAAVLNEFQGGSNVREGEFLMSQGNSFGYYVDLSVIRTLAVKDFDRTIGLVDEFSRREMRLGLKLQLLEGGLN